MMFPDRPDYLDADGASRCGLPAEVEYRDVVASTGGPLESAVIRCLSGRWFNAAVEFLTCKDGAVRGPGGTGDMPPFGLTFRRIVDIPFETCVAAFESWQRTEQDGALHIGRSLLRGPAELNRDFGTCRIDVRLARGSPRPPLRMRLDIDHWSSSPARSALELIPCRRVRPTAAYFRAGHLLLDALTRSLLQHLPAQRPSRITAIQPHPHQDRSDQGSRLLAPHLRPAQCPDLPHPTRCTDASSATHTGAGS